ncbi:MAG: ribonuclease III [Patescibacteria group bacterium]
MQFQTQKAEDAIGIVFKDKELLMQAFVHRSYLNENPDFKLEHNERLEFLGDAVLELAVTNFLFHKYPKNPEGDLTAYRSALVNTQTISEASSDLGVNDFLLLSKGEAKDTGRARQTILADLFEAIIGAIYLDQGFEIAEGFVAKNLFGKIDEVISKRLWQDSKSYFQEKAQEVFGSTPNYKVMGEVGPDHDKRFTVAVYIGDRLSATGSGHSKQEAEQDAALAALTANSWR